MRVFAVSQRLITCTYFKIGKLQLFEISSRKTFLIFFMATTDHILFIFIS